MHSWHSSLSAALQSCAYTTWDPFHSVQLIVSWTSVNWNFWKSILFKGSEFLKHPFPASDFSCPWRWAVSFNTHPWGLSQQQFFTADFVFPLCSGKSPACYCLFGMLFNKPVRNIASLSLLLERSRVKATHLLMYWSDRLSYSSVSQLHLFEQCCLTSCWNAVSICWVAAWLLQMLCSCPEAAYLPRAELFPVLWTPWDGVCVQLCFHIPCYKLKKMRMAECRSCGVGISQHLTGCSSGSCFTHTA